ncbi:MAG TPA: HAMP domain-containing sensor histidine kinase [Candidatus Dormibacteraeota bacterium]
MSDVLHVLQAAVAASFVLLGVVALGEWLRERRSSSGWIALSIGMLGVVAGAGLVGTEIGAPNSPVISAIAVTAFVLSAYGLLRFRGTFIPLGPVVHRTALAALTAVLILELVLVWLPDALPHLVAAVAAALLVVAWSLSVADPVVRLALASRGLPSVQAARLRSLAAGFGGLIVIVLLAGIAPDLERRPYVAIAVELVALAMAPLLYASFAPPTWLRRIWRAREEERLQLAVRELILFSPTRRELAHRAAEWAMRLVGGDAALIADADGTPLAHEGLPPDRARELLEGTADGDDARIARTGGAAAQTAIVVPLDLSSGRGTLLVLAGPYTPYFGADELQRLNNYAIAIIAGLDRANLTERLAALERTKSEFLNLASHELRGPITLIRGYLSMLAAGSFGQIPDELTTVLPVLEAKADEMNSLIEQMIEAARLEEGRLELHPADTDLRELAQRVIDTIGPLATQTHQLILESTADEVRAYVDPERVSTILSNLLSNALKYSPQGGEVRLTLTADNEFAVIAVTDHGVGIAKEDLKTLFTRFGRISTRETQHIAGTGLGLYLSRELAKLHGGDLTVSSRPGLGSTFRVTLKRTVGGSSPAARAQPA